MKSTIDPFRHSSSSSVSPLVATTPSVLNAGASFEETMIVFFEDGKCSLSEREIGALEQWVRRWNSLNCRWRLYLGGADETSRANRLRRLSVLMAALEHLGVARRRIQVDGEWLRATRLGIIDDLPADNIWLQVRGLHAQYVMSANEICRQHRY